MNINHDNEATQYQGKDNEATQYGNKHTAKPKESKTEKKDAAKGSWKNTAAGAAGGVLLGSVSAVLMGMKKADEPVEPDESGTPDNHRDHLSNPDWVDDDIAVATEVNDDMSFGEAFAAARAEVGPGGCFEWHGNVYSTHTAEEWNSMTPAERADFNNHFSWNHSHHSSGSTSHHGTAEHTADHTADNTATASSGSAGHHTSSGHTAQTNTAGNTDDDIEVVSVNHAGNHNNSGPQTSHVAQNNTDTHHDTPSQQNTDPHHNTGSQSSNTHTVSMHDEPGNDEPEIEILGVVHDEETGANIGGMTVDGQEVVLIDVDNNLEFDYMISDFNNNGMIDDDEVVDIQGGGLTVADLGGFTDPAGDMMVSNDTPDYSTDVYEG